LKYPLFKVHIPVKESLNNLKKVLNSGFINEGLEVKKFQNKLIKFLDVENLILTNSCTSALTLALKISGVGPGTEVITTPMTCIATNTPIVNLGAKIVWADVNPRNGSINPLDIEKKITDKTRAIVFVNWAGTPIDLDKISKLGKKHKISTIQDSAHSFGATWNNICTSNYTDYTCFSFQAIKHLSTGDGGALVCRSRKSSILASKLKWFGFDRNKAKDEKGNWKGQRWSDDIKPEEIGYKFNMNNISATIGLSQMKYISNLLDLHRRNAKVYSKIFTNESLIKKIDVPLKAKSSYWVYTFIFNGKETNRDKLIKNLNLAGIEAGLVHLPNDIYSAFEKFKTFLPGTRSFSSTQISIPCGWWLTLKDCEFIANKVIKLANKLK
jgi:dTDP-4-amino-4,6-dideoxygalactose transaminase